MVVTVRTLRKLESAGFDRVQAEALVEAFDADLDDLATKMDLRSLATKADVATVKADIATVKADIYRAMLVQTFAIAGMLFAALRIFG